MDGRGEKRISGQLRSMNVDGIPYKELLASFTLTDPGRRKVCGSFVRKSIGDKIQMSQTKEIVKPEIQTAKWEGSNLEEGRERSAFETLWKVNFENEKRNVLDYFIQSLNNDSSIDRTKIVCQLKQEKDASKISHFASQREHLTIKKNI